MPHFAALVFFVLVSSLHPITARAAAILIPDHTSRLGTCGGPQGPACTWECGVGNSCPADGACSVHATQAFSAILNLSVDDTPCGGAPGSFLTIGLTQANVADLPEGTAWQLTDTLYDLCNRDVSCSGRRTRSCGMCVADDDCSSDGGDGDYPCPPGPAIFLCSDPCGSDVTYLDEASFPDLADWLAETVQPVPELLRNQLPNPPAEGKPVIYHAEPPIISATDPPAAEVCVRIAYTSQDLPLSVCSNDTTKHCTSDADCEGGTCEQGTPPGLNPAVPDTTGSTFACAVPGSDAGFPCGSNADCDSGVCDPLPVTGFGYCRTSSPPVITSPSCDPYSCPSGSNCWQPICPEPSCGDGIIDPGEACDAGPFGPGNGCDASCNVEPCFDCEGRLGGSSSCTQLLSGEPCDLDGRPCTADTCGSSGACEAGVAPTGCAAALATKSQIQIKSDLTDPTKAGLKWKWTGESPFDVAGLGFPSTIDDLSLCAYDQSGVVFEATAPAGGDCAGKPCWSIKKGKVGYKDKEATPDGLTKTQGKSGDAGKGKLQAQGKGASLAVPMLPLAPPLKVLLMRGNAEACWEATYPSPTVNDSGQLKAKN